MSRQSPTDRPAVSGRAEGGAAHESMNQQAGAARILFKLITFPFWIPFVLASGLKERREMRRFILEQSGDQPITNTLTNDLAVMWAERNPKRYPHGRYDRKFRRLKTRFESTARLLQARRGY